MADRPGSSKNAVDIMTKLIVTDEFAQGVKNCNLVKKYGLSKSTISTIFKDKK